MDQAKPKSGLFLLCLPCFVWGLVAAPLDFLDIIIGDELFFYGLLSSGQAFI